MSALDEHSDLAARNDATTRDYAQGLIEVAGLMAQARRRLRDLREIPGAAGWAPLQREAAHDRLAEALDLILMAERMGGS